MTLIKSNYFERPQNFKSQYHGFLLTNGVFTTIDYPGAEFTQARGINDAGQIVGYYRDPGMHIEYGFLWTNGAYVSFHSAETLFFDINNAGQIVGISSPLPGSFLLLGSGLLGLMGWRRLKKG